MNRTCAGCGAPSNVGRACAYCDSPCSLRAAEAPPPPKTPRGTHTIALLTTLMEREREKREEAFGKHRDQITMLDLQRRDVVEGFQRHVLPLLGLIITIWTLGLLAATSAGTITFATDPEGTRTWLAAHP